MAENRTGTGSDYSRHPAPLCGEDAVSDGIDAAIEDMQATELDPVIDRVTADAVRPQLAARDNAVLARRELGDPPIQEFNLRLTAYHAVNLIYFRHGAEIRG
jgi:hypothetical protein